MTTDYEGIMGDRPLSPVEVSLINSIRKLGMLINDHVKTIHNDPNADPRWASIASTHFQQGLMALERAVARPHTY
jgi:hypothetical protein